MFIDEDDYLKCQGCGEPTHSSDLIACDFKGCRKDYLCPNCIGGVDGRQLCLRHCDLLEAAEVAA